MGGRREKRNTSCPYFVAGVGHDTAIVVACQETTTNYYWARELALQRKMKYQLKGTEHLLQLQVTKGKVPIKKRLPK